MVSGLEGVPPHSVPPRKTRQRQIGAFSRLQDEVVQGPATRRSLYERLEKDLGSEARVVAFFTSFTWPVLIDDQDADILEETLRNTLTTGDRLILLLNSPGGDALAAERIVNVCNEFSNGSFSVIVPKMAKSAATMVCLGATEIGMSQNSELGPIDPQILIPGEQGQQPRYLAAHEIRDSFERLMQQAIEGAGRIEPLLQQLSRYDARDMEWIKSQQELSKSIAIKLLKSGALGSTVDEDIETRIRPFLDPTFTKSHGRPIYHDVAKRCGLNIKLYPLRGAFWGTVWELYVRLRHVVTDPSRGISKIVESSRETYTAEFRA